jgi:hypothetical protein
LEKKTSRSELAVWVTKWAATQHPLFGRSGRKAIRKLGHAAGVWPLVFWAAATGWFGKRAAARALAEMADSREQFEDALGLLGKSIPPAAFVTPQTAPHADLVVEAASVAWVTEGPLLALVAAVLAVSRGDALGPLAGRVAGLSHAGLRKVEQMTAGAAVDPAFAAAVRSGLAAVRVPAWCAIPQ